ncbi:MAG: hypothetical protein AAGF93_22135 [Cyanobacteria bacterium P01_H01_bin.105]
MPSSSRPYKSKLLRFVLQQWQQGLERQDQAWRQLQSTATWGAQVAVFPLYAIIRAVKRAGFALGSSSNTPAPQSTPEISTQTKSNVTDIEHSFTAILTHTQQLLSPEQTSQLAIRPKSGLIHKVKSLLSGVIGQIQKQLPAALQVPPRSAALIKTQRGSHSLTTDSRTASKDLVKSGHSRLQQRVSSTDLGPLGSTLASAIETRQLVLVTANNQIFDIFTTEQQSDIKDYISRVMYAYQQSRTIAPRRTRRLSAKTILAIGAVFIAALPMEFRKAWSQITPYRPEPSLPPIATNGAQPNSRVFYPATGIVHTETSARTGASMRTGHGRTGQLPGKASRRRLSSKAPDAFEANINDVKYLEHPLERVLRLIDRVLTWCEHRWQQWLERNANIG